MTQPLVQNQLALTYANKPVYITLVGGNGFVGSTLEVARVYATTTTDDTGKWSVAHDANSTINPANTHYHVSEPGGGEWDYIVPAGAGPFNLFDILAVPPPTPNAYLSLDLVDNHDGTFTSGSGVGGYTKAGANAVLATEAATRAAADATLTTNLAAEATARTNADNAEATARTNADNAEATARASADAAETARATAAEALLVPLSQLGVPNGAATLDSAGHLLNSQLPLGVFEYKGTWNAATNTPALANGTGRQGDIYVVSAAGTVNFGAGGIKFAIGDRVAYNGTIWDRNSAPDGVSTVAGRMGDVVLTTADLTDWATQNALAAHLAGAETFTGAKTFNVSPVVPTANPLDASTKAASTAYADAAVAVEKSRAQTFEATLPTTYGGLGLGARAHGYAATNSARQEVLTPVRVLYNPSGSATTYTHTGDTLWTDVDATNLAATIIVPPSGKIRIQQGAWMSTTGGAIGRWGVADGIGDLVESQSALTTNAAGARYSATTVITKDGGGTPLVPGATITLRWRFQIQNGAQTISMVVGGQGTTTPTGPAEMILTPVSNRIPAKTVTVSVAASPTDLVWDVQPDGQHMIGWDTTLSRIAYSSNAGSSWTALPNLVTPAGTKGAWYAGDGEILVDAGVTGTSPGSIWKSSGWAANPATATFAKVLTANNLSGSNDVYFGAYSGHPTTRGIHAVSEYGPKNGPNDMARYAYKSTDYGSTWQQVLDLYTVALGIFPGGWDGTSTHLHSIVYDPFWDCMWAVSGDWNSTTVNPLVLVCFNWNASSPTWQVIYQGHQFTSIIPMPECILFGTDEGTSSPDSGKNGIWRLRREGAFKTGPMEVALATDSTANQTVVGGWWSRPEWVPDSPTIIGMGQTVTSGPTGRIWATYDGFSFQNLWTATDTGTNGSVVQVTGPVNGVITAAYKANADSSPKEQVTITLS